MTTRQFRATSNGIAFDVEVNADTSRVRNASEDAPSDGPVTPGAPRTAEPAAAAPSGDARHDASIAPRAFQVTALGGDGLRVTPSGSDEGSTRSQRALVVSDGDLAWVWIDGDAFIVEVEAAERARRPRAPAGAEGLSAPMPATVIRILTEPGKEVRRGETLLLLEAMKMELPVRAPRDGRVKALHCQPGELVQPGVTLVDLA